MKSTLGPTRDEVMAGLPPERRARIAAEGKRLVAHEMTLRELRKAHAMTQVKLAETLGTSQNQISRLEQRSDLLLSTLRDYVEAMGGKLNLVAEFPNLPPVIIAGLTEIE